MHGTSTRLQTARNIKLQGAVSGEASFDGSRDITITTTQANIVTITGILKAGTEQTEINYPSGFNFDNCEPISFSSQFKKGYYTNGFTFDTVSSARGALSTAVSTNANNILLRYQKVMATNVVATIDTDYPFKLVLLKTK